MSFLENYLFLKVNSKLNNENDDVIEFEENYYFYENIFNEKNRLLRILFLYKIINDMRFFSVLCIYFRMLPY